MTATPALWAAVDTLTRPARVPVEHDDGRVSYTLVPSLLRQAQTALRRVVVRGSAGTLARERSLLDLDLFEATGHIHATVAHELATRGLLHAHRHDSDEARLRHLAGHIVGHEPQRTWYWQTEFGGWARQLSRYLHVGDHQPTPLRLRNSPCPTCGTRQVTIPTPDGARVVPALVIEFNRGLVRAAECGQCGTQWSRGLELESLAGLLAL